MNEGLVNDIKEIKEMLMEAKTAEAARVERERIIQSDVEKLKNTVDGNGKPGLKTDMQLLKEQMGRVNWIGAIVVSAFIMDIISRIVAR